MNEPVAPARLWRHLPDCFGCGPANPSSLGMRFTVVEGGVRGDVTFDDRHVGGPGLAHGGAIMTVLDEVMGSVAGTGERRRVTATMEVQFRKPVALGRPLVALGRIVETLPRGYLVEGTLAYADEPDVVRARATARFVSVREDGDRRPPPDQP